MRVLFSFAGGTGHAEPMVPLARALQAAGHTVAFAGHARHLTRLETQGFAIYAVEGSAGGPVSDRQPLLEPSQENEDRVIRECVSQLPRRRAARSMELYERWRPDVVVRDEMDFGAAVLTERLGIPHAVVLVLAAGSFVRPEVVAEPLNALRAEHGMAADLDLSSLQRDVVLSPFPPGFRDPAFPLPPTAHAFRQALGLSAGSDTPPPWWGHMSGRPIVHVTLGTVFPLESGDLFERIIEAVGQLPVEVVATVGPDLDPADLGAQPDHVHVERWMPQSLLLPRTSLVISHGGSGTVTAALAHGLPQIVVAMGADQLHNADRVEALGIGRSLHPVSTTTAEIRDTTAALLADQDARASAERLQRETAALPGPESAIPLLEHLVRATPMTS